MGKISLLVIALVSLAVVASAASPWLYDAFSSGELDPNKWEARQDPEGQPFTEEYGIEFENGNYGFHIKQISIGDHRTYLVPLRRLEIGDTLEYEYNLISKTGHYGNSVLLVGEEYRRSHLFSAGYNNGIQNYDELGVSHIKITFTGTSFDVEARSPSGGLFYSSLPVSNPDGNYELYIGSWSGHNGNVHTYFDNFWINGIAYTDLAGRF